MGKYIVKKIGRNNQKQYQTSDTLNGTPLPTR